MLLLFLVLPQTGFSQHCAPIGQSYLSEISLKEQQDDFVTAHIEYCKRGGNTQDVYQIYLLAYLEKNADTIPTPVSEDAKQALGEPLFDENSVIVLETKLIERNEEGCFDYDYSQESDVLIEQLISELMSEEEVNDRESWGEIKSPIRLAVFIPFLEDERYASLEGLPEDRHECNYRNRRALVWQRLPYRINLHRYSGKKPKYWMQINGDQPEPGFF